MRLLQYGRVLFSATFALLGLSLPAGAQEIERLEFVSAPLTDMLVALGSATGRSIVVDPSVTGRGSYHFGAMEFDEALAAFSERFGLFVDTHDGIYSVSALRVRVDTDASPPLVAVEAPRIGVDLLLERVSRATGVPILFERLPLTEIAFYCSPEPLEQLLCQIAARLPDHTLTEDHGAFILRFNESRSQPPRESWIAHDADGYSIESGTTSLPELLALLFAEGGREYQLLKRGSASIPGLSYSNKSFDAMLTLILDQVDATFALVDGVYYIVATPSATAVARTLTTRIVALDRLAPQAVLDLLPPELIADVTIRQDRSAAALTLTGVQDAVDRVAALIASLDAPREGVRTHRFALVSVRPSELVAMLPHSLAALHVSASSDGTSVLVEATDGQAARFAEFLALADRGEQGRSVELRYIAADELLAHPPASVRPDELVRTSDSHRVLYYGPDERLDRFLADLRRIDVPRPQIRYQLIVLQFQEGHSLTFDLELSNALTAPDTAQAFLANLGSLVALDFDLVSAFGYHFVAQLEASVGNASARLVADTTLCGLSGETVSFRNTNTYRYRDTSVDSESGEQSVAIVREITSGLIVELRGEAVEDGVIVDIAATVSRRGVDADTAGNPPPTSEKVVRSRVHAKAGEPIVVSGLRQRELESTKQGVPLLSRIPLLGWLFSARRDTSDTTELAIYIVPWVDRPAATINADAELDRLFERFVGSGR